MRDTPPLPRHFFDLEEELPEIRLDSHSNPVHEASSGNRGAFSPRSLGVFSTKEQAKDPSRKTYWMVEQTGPSSFSARTLDQNGQPTGLPMPCTAEEFLRRFEPEVEYFGQRILPNLTQNNQADSLARGDARRGQAQDPGARAAQARPQENGARALFDLGMFYLKGQDETRSRAVFRDLAHLPGPFEQAHKHLFNEFGIALRKSHLYEEALEHYQRAVALGQDDEHVYFNMARAHHAKGDWTGCVKALTECLARNQEVAAARKFCLYLLRREEEKTARLEKTHPNMAKIIMAESRKLLDQMLAAAGFPDQTVARMRTDIRAKLERAGRVKGLA